MAEFDQDDAARAAQARDAIPTLAEVMAADHWVTLADGGIVPVRLARADGWGQDEDRDSAMAQALSQHVKHLDDLVRGWERSEPPFDAPYPDQAEFVNLINALTGTWSAIRKITRSNGGR